MMGIVRVSIPKFPQIAEVDSESLWFILVFMYIFIHPGLFKGRLGFEASLAPRKLCFNQEDRET